MTDKTNISGKWGPRFYKHVPLENEVLEIMTMLL